MITGGAGGMGLATAKIVGRDHTVVLADVRQDRLDAAAAEVTALRIAALPVHADVTDRAAVDQLFATATEFGPIASVIHTAGVSPSMGPADYVARTNAVGAVNVNEAFYRFADAGAAIVNVASMAAYAPLGTMNAYCTSKAAVYMFSDCLRAELAGAGVGLTTICPGVVDTNIVNTTRFDAPHEQAEAARARARKLYAARRYGPDKVAKAIVSAVKQDKAIRLVTPEAHLLYGVSRVLPRVLRSTARGRAV